MDLPLHSRRRFLRGTGTLAGSAWLTATFPAIKAAAEQAAGAARSQAPFSVLSNHEAATLAAIAAQIIPSDETPGAREAGVVYFLDTAFSTFMRGALGALREDLPAFEAGVKEAFAGRDRFVALDDAQQVAYLEAHEDGAMFGLVSFLTKVGMFAMPSYGGNRDHAGWKLIGFEHRHAWLPPFGHYDARRKEDAPRADNADE